MKYILITVLCIVASLLTANELELSPLAKLPSQPQEHISKIKNLKNNEWLSLGKPNPDSKWGRARGRAYTPKMAYAAHLEGAFITGEGVHGWFDKETNQYMDDVWFYDINANAWICIKPGSDGDTLDLKLNEDGFEVNQDGKLMPVAFLGHGNDMTAYDDENKKFIMITDALNTYWKTCLGPKRNTWIKNDKQIDNWKKSPWLFDTQTGLWQRQKIEGLSPSFNAGRNTSVTYLPNQKKFFINNPISGPFYFDAKKYAYEKINTDKKLPLKGTPVSMYDPHQKRVYFVGVGKENFEIWYFDLNKNEWISTNTDTTHLDVKHPYTTGYMTLQYDHKNKICLLRHSYQLYAYDLNTHVLAKEPIQYPDELKTKWMCYHSFYATNLNAHFIYLAGDSKDNGVFWVYRYQE